METCELIALKKLRRSVLVTIVALVFLLSFGSVISENDVYPAGQIYYGNQSWDSWNDHNNPPAYYYNNTIYLGYGNTTDYDSWLVTFDTISKTFGTPLKVADNLDPGDSHGTPTLIVNESGYIYVFNSAHVGTSYLWRSSNPEDTSSWDNKADLGDSCSYPNVAPASDGDLYIFYRSGGGSSTALKFVKYDTSANSYSGTTSIISSSDWWYPTSITIKDDDSIHLGFNQRDSSSSGSYRNSYYLYTDDYGSTFYNADGTDLSTIDGGLPLSRSEADNYLMIEDFAITIPYGPRWCTRANVDSNGIPAACYLRGDGSPVNEEEDGVWVRFAYWNSTAHDWDIVTITAIPLIGHFGQGCGWEAACYPRCKTKQYVSKPYFQDNGDIIVLLSECEFFTGNNVSNIKVYKSTDSGQSWAFEENLTSDTSVDSNKWMMHDINNIDNYVMWLTAPEFLGGGWSNISIGRYVSSGAGDSLVEFSSINGQENNAILQDQNRFFNWTRAENATEYSIRISNTPAMGDIFLQLDNITVSNGWCTNNFLNTSNSASPYAYNYWENSTHCFYYLPYVYNITDYGYDYYQVRTYTT